MYAWYLNSIVNGIKKFPSMACKNGAVLLGGAEYTTNMPLSASKNPIRNSCHCGNLRSSTVTAPNAADTSDKTPNITTKEKDAELKTKNGSMLGPSVPLITFELSDSLWCAVPF